MNISIQNPPEGATHFSEEVPGVYWPAFWKEGDGGCWAFVGDDRTSPEWIFHECCEIPSRAKAIGATDALLAAHEVAQ